LTPEDRGALNFTRLRWGSFLLTSEETFCRRVPVMIPFTRSKGLSRASIEIKEGMIPSFPLLHSMAVHTISLAGAVLIILLAIVFLFLIGPLGLLILILAAVLLWYAFGPGGHVITTT
jgi:hypothetical protein